MRVHVDERECIGCLLCTDLCPDVFEIHNGLSVPRHPDGVVPQGREACAADAVDVCAVEAITVEK